MKTLIKNLIVPALASRPVSALAENMLTTGIPVFMLHRFSSTENYVKGHEPAFLDKCLQYLSYRNYHFISLEQIINAMHNGEPLPKRSIAFTMDDGFLDQATVAAPIFIKYKCPVTIFLISGMLDKELWPWDDKISFLINNTHQRNISLELAGQKKTFPLQNTTAKKSAVQQIQNWVKTLSADHVDHYLRQISLATGTKLPFNAPQNYQAMTWDIARELEKQGINFAPHTNSHRILSKLNDTGSSFEITHSWKRLGEELASPSPVFCYPTGRAQDFSEREIENIKQLGLAGAVSTEATFIDLDSDEKNYLYQLPRYGFPDTMTDFIQYSSWIERAKNRFSNR